MRKWVVGFFLCSGLSAFAQDEANSKDQVTPKVETPKSGPLQINPEWWREQAWSTTTRLGTFATALTAGMIVLGGNRMSSLGWLGAAWLGSQIVHDAYRERGYGSDTGWWLRKSSDATLRGMVWHGVGFLVPGKGLIHALAAAYLGDIVYEAAKAALFGGPLPVKREGVVKKIGALAD